MKSKEILRIFDSACTEFEEGMKNLRFNTISKLQNKLRTAYTKDEFSHILNTDNESGKKVHSSR